MKKTVLIAVSTDYSKELSGFEHTVPLSPPLGVLAVGSYLAAQNVPVELIDMQMDFGFGLTEAAEQVVMQRIARYLSQQAQDIAWIGISQLSTTSIGVALAQASHALLPDIPIIFGGYFSSGNYRTLLEEYPCITAIVRGDGEMAALEISRSLAEGRSFLSEQTPNLAWREGPEIRTTPQQSVAIDSLPILDFRLLHHPTDYPYIDLMTSRGCPYACSYCLEANMRSFANYPTTWVDQQFKHLEEVVPNDRITLFDPIFGVGKKRTLEICQLLRERRFAYTVESRVDVLAPELTPTLAAAKVEIIYLGFESASVGTLVRMNKVPSIARAEAYVKSSFEVLKACFEDKITPAIGLMLGFPGDIEADQQATLAYVKEVKQLYETVAAQTGAESGFVLMPFITKVYEGSPLAKRVEQDFPGIILHPDPFLGSRSIVRISPELDADMAGYYIAEVSNYDAWTPFAAERFQNYMLFPLKAFLEQHPELTDEEGVTLLGNSLRHYQANQYPAHPSD
jgi:B12 binding domain